LIALTWLIPFFILKKSQPSLEKSALAGLNKGIANAFSLIENEVSVIIDTIAQQHTQHCQQLNTLISDCDRNVPLPIQQNNLLHRMLL